MFILIIYLSAKKIKKMREAAPYNATTDDAADLYKKMKNDGQVLSGREIDYQQLANSIAINLKGCESFATETQVIADIKKVIKKPIDWYYLVKVFGVKEIDDCGWGKTTYALPELLKDQLDTAVPAGPGGLPTESINVLTDYLKTKGVTL
jgi:hypothetical protein